MCVFVEQEVFNVSFSVCLSKSQFANLLLDSELSMRVFKLYLMTDWASYKIHPFDPDITAIIYCCKVVEIKQK